MPKVELKKGVIDSIKETMEGSSSIVLVDYRGLTVEEDTQLRKAMREAGVTYKVFKNSMMNFAFDGTEYESLKEDLAGPSAIAISYEDPTAGPRTLLNQSKELTKLEFKAGVVEGTYYDSETIVKIAAIPSREELLSKLLGSIKSPISSFARVAKAIAEKMDETGVETAAGLATGASTEEAPVVEETPAVDATKEEE